MQSCFNLSISIFSKSAKKLFEINSISHLIYFYLMNTGFYTTTEILFLCCNWGCELKRVIERGKYFLHVSLDRFYRLCQTYKKFKLENNLISFIPYSTSKAFL